MWRAEVDGVDHPQWSWWVPVGLSPTGLDHTGWETFKESTEEECQASFMHWWKIRRSIKSMKCLCSYPSSSSRGRWQQTLIWRFKSEIKTKTSRQTLCEWHWTGPAVSDVGLAESEFIVHLTLWTIFRFSSSFQTAANSRWRRPRSLSTWD